MAETKAAIDLQQVSYQVDENIILDHITGSFATGKITALVGPSGAGKTTVFHLCNGMRSVSEGDIHIQGMHIDQYEPTKLRRTVGTALQQATMIQGSVYDNLSLPLKLQAKKLSRKQAEELLRIVGLDTHLLKRNAKELSGGQKQKISIARTLVNHPPILLLDEITSSLDQNAAREIEKLISKINQSYHTTIIWITHSLEQAKRIADNVWIMMEGQVIEQGSVDILHEPKTDEAKHFIKGGEQS